MIVQGHEIVYILFNILWFPCRLHSRPVHRTRMFSCTLFLYRLHWLGVSRRTLWSSEIGWELLEPHSINNCDWFLIPSDHPQCVWLIQSYKLAVPSEVDLKLLLVQRQKRPGDGTWALFFGLIGWMYALITGGKKMQKKKCTGLLNVIHVLTRSRSIFEQENKPLCCIL